MNTKQYVDSVTDKDVLCGRGGTPNHHPGNQWFHGRIVMNKPKYVSSSKTEKTALSRGIVHEVHCRGGRFLKKDSATGRYFEISVTKALRKTSQAFREEGFKWIIEDDIDFEAAFEQFTGDIDFEDDFEKFLVGLFDMD